MTMVKRRVQNANFAVETYSKYKNQEELRLLIACVGMGTVTVLEVVDYIRRVPWRKEVSITRIVFVTLQLMMLLWGSRGTYRRYEDDEFENDRLYDDEKVEKGFMQRKETRAGTTSSAGGVQRISFVSISS
ncbi:hypothetical protein BCR33DRAFT_741546 [Rhizoclosmatium globosum]|uniref:Uncharacterized protein n=1 Tax=Rhizoclosmatium globosum TaxID=329046 RepID=A0A1Y2BUA1_9FUNG|nr:hypothetical protein BCR33DRAFT_741546 [Rhizoclosmatium globosum]|eukprot:ORY38331.1 hypothetical protein BCR33DRAFT_741546 [Rhizoclosmatium globosum]